MNSSIVTFDNLTVGFDKHPVVSDISLSILRSSFTAILGANGSGKSTLLKTLLGLQPPIAGRILTFPANGGPLVFGYVPQTFQFDPLYPLTSFDVALMGVYGRVKSGRLVPQAERAFARECLHAAGADEFAHKRFGELSGGQKQRTLIARALAAKPDVFALDEPTVGVDAAATQALLEFLERLQQECAPTVLLVTHDLPLVRKHAQDVIWLHQGRVLHGPVSEVLTAERMNEIFEKEAP